MVEVSMYSHTNVSGDKVLTFTVEKAWSLIDPKDVKEKL